MNRIVSSSTLIARRSMHLALLTACVLSISQTWAAGPATDPTLQPASVDTMPGPKYADSTRRFQGIPGLERAANGRLWALWYAGGTGEGGENYVVLVTSADDGKTWSGPRLVIDPPGDVRAYDPTLWHDPQGRMWLFWAQSYHWWDGRSGVWAIACENSGDECPKWSAPRRLANGIMMNKPTVLTNGDWLLPVSMWAQKATKSTKSEYQHDLPEEVGAQAVVSHDQGKSFTMLGKTRAPESIFDEHSIVERRDGSLWMLMRTKFGIAESTSADGGKTWTPGKPSSIPHVNSRFFIRRLASGKLLLVKHAPPDNKTRSHLTAYLSTDDGRTWTGGLMLDERVGVSYPDGVQGPDGVIRIIYDYQRTQDKLILMAAFTEDDIARGQPSTSTRLRVKVNQATGEPLVKAKAAATGPTRSPVASGKGERQPNKRDTDWFKTARYGVFMHFLPSAAGAQSLALVEKFDVNVLADQLELMGAKYFVITLGQNSGCFNAPNGAYDKITGYAPGERCATRDLPMDLYRVLHPKGIRLMLYLPCQTPNRDVRAQKAFGLAQGPKDQSIDVEFARKWARVIEEWSDRYGDKVAGWWFDGGYKWVHFDENIARIYADAAKHGNPHSIVTFNPGVKVIHYTQAEDYTAGELSEPFGQIPTSRWLEGSQWHVLTYLGKTWGQRTVREPTERWVAWVKAVVAHEGVVTLDMGPNWNPQAGPIGSLAEAQVEQVRAIRAALTNP